MINILQLKKEKDLKETFVFVGKVKDNETYSSSNCILKVKAKSLEEATKLIRKYGEKVGKEVEEEKSFMFSIEVLNNLDIVSIKDLEKE